MQIRSSDNSINVIQEALCDWDLTIASSEDNALDYGGVVTWIQDYDFRVSAAGYHINGVPYTSPEAFITLSPADPLLDRFDVIYVDADGMVKVLEGVPSITASQPGLDLGLQVGLGVIFVQAASTQPNTASEECGYIDNSEWSAFASDASIDVGSGNTPCSGTVSIEGTTVTTGDYFKLVRGTPFALSPNFNNFHFLIRSKGSWGNRKLNIQWYSGGVAVGTAVAFGHNTYNFASSNVADCQFIAIDASDFNMPVSQTVDEIRFTMSGGNNIGFFIDNICIQNNGSIVSPGDNDIHNQYFGPQPDPGSFWIQNHGRADGWFTSPDVLTGGDGSEKFGWGSRVTGSTGTAIGFLAQAHGQEGATAVGNQSVANVGVAIGFGATSVRGVAIGGSQTGSGGTVVGWGANSNALSTVAIGGNAAANTGPGNIAVGYYAQANGGYGNIALGTGSAVTHNFSAAIGVFATTTAANQLVIGGDETYTDTGFTSLYFGSGVTSPWSANRFWSITGAEGTNTVANSWTFAGARGTGTGASGPIYWQTSDPTISGTTQQGLSTKVGLNSNTLGFYLDNTRFQMDEGVNVTASGDLVLGTGNYFTVDGNTTVNAITSTNWQDGAVIYLLFSQAPTLKHNTAGGAGTSPIRLAGATDFAATANTVLALGLKDGYWREIGRTQASAMGPYTFLNGLHEVINGIVKLGGTLIEDTTITLGANDFTLNKNAGGDIKFLGLTNSVLTNIIYYDPVTGNITYGIAPSGGGGGDITANNGITENVADNVQLGGPLVQNTNVSMAGFQMVFDLEAGANTVTFDGNSGVDPFVAIHLENVGLTKTTDFQLYNDGLSFTQNYSLITNSIQADSGGVSISSDDGTEDSYISIDAAGYSALRASKAFQVDASRFELAKGTSAVAANDLTLPSDGNVFSISGTTTINAITSADWQAGSVIYLLFDAATTVKHNTAGGGGTASILLNGGVDLVTDATTVLTLVYNGTAWEETSRKSEAVGSSGIVSADNGLKLSTATNVQLGASTNTGAPLLHTTYVDLAAYSIAFTDGGVITGGVGSGIFGGDDQIITGHNSVAIGGANTEIHANGAVSVGTDGHIYAGANYAFIANDANDVWGESAAVFNFGNDVYATCGFAIGTSNMIGGTANQYSNSFVGGSASNATGDRAFAFGEQVTSTGTNTYTFGKGVTNATAQSFAVGFNSVAPDFIITEDKIRINSARFEEYKGANVIAANDLTLGTDGNLFTITGATTVNAITTANWQAGSTVGFVFTGAPLIKHNTAGGGGTATLLLAGSEDYQAAAGDYIEFRYDGTNWHEIGRKLAGSTSGPTFTLNNGLTKNTATNGQLGSATPGGAPLLHDTYIGDASAFSILATSTVTGTNSTIISYNTSSGAGLFGAAISGVGTGGSATSGTGGAFRATSGIGLTAHSDSSYAFIADITPTSTNTVVPIFSLQRGVSGGSGANGVGVSIEMGAETSTGVTWPGTTLVSKWTTATEASRVSEYSITGVNNAITSTLFTLSGNGQITGNKYGVGTFTGTEAYRLAVTSSGAIVEKTATQSKGLFVEFPSGTESIGMWKTPVAITVSSINAVLVGSGSPSVTMNIAFGTDRTSGTNVFSSGQAVTSTTTGHTFNSGFNDATIPAGSFIWFTTSAQSGTVTQIEVTLNYTED